MNARSVLVLLAVACAGTPPRPALRAEVLAPPHVVPEMAPEPDPAWRWYGDGNVFVHLADSEALDYHDGVTSAGDRVVAFDAGGDRAALLAAIDAPVSVRFDAGDACGRAAEAIRSLEARGIEYAISTHDALTPEEWECVRVWSPRALFTSDPSTRELFLSNERWRAIVIGFATHDLDAAGVAQLRSFPALRVLALDRTAAPVLELLGELPLLELSLAGRSVTDEAFDRTVGREPRLRRLTLSYTAVSDLAPIARMHALEELDLRRASIDHAQLRHVEHLTHLERLDLSFTAVTDIGALRGLTAMEYLDLRDTHVASLAPLAAMESLRVLRATNTAINGGELAAIANCRALTELYLADTTVDGASLRHLTALNALEVLDLSHTQVDDAGLAHLRGLTHLESLSLFGAEITGPGLAHLAGLPSLSYLDVSGTSLDVSAVAALGSLSHLDRQLLELGYVQFRGDGVLEPARSRTELRTIVLWGSNITNAGLAPIAGLTDVTLLDLGRTDISDAGLVHVRGMRGLTRLRLQFTEITDAGMAHIAQLTELRTLELVETNVGDAGVARIARLPLLEELLLDGTRITNRGVRALRTLQHLRSLGLGYTAVTEEAIPDILAHPGLVEITIGGAVEYDDGRRLEAAMSEAAQQQLRDAIAVRTAH